MDWKLSAHSYIGSVVVESSILNKDERFLQRQELKRYLIFPIVQIGMIYLRSRLHGICVCIVT